MLAYFAQYHKMSTLQHQPNSVSVDTECTRYATPYSSILVRRLLTEWTSCCVGFHFAAYAFSSTITVHANRSKKYLHTSNIHYVTNSIYPRCGHQVVAHKHLYRCLYVC